MSEVDWEFGQITDDGIAKLKAAVGRRSPLPGWNNIVTADGIWKFAAGIGDNNPLWWDPAYALASPWKAQIAPPAYMYTHTTGIRTSEHAQMTMEEFLPGVGSLWAGEHWRWRRPAQVGERISAETFLTEVVVNDNTKFGGRSVSHTERAEYRTPDGELVADVDHIIKRFDRGQAKSRGTYAKRPLAVYTADDRARLDAHYAGEAKALRRGDRPRYVEDVRVGEAVGPMLKGPLNLGNMIGFLMGYGSSQRSTNRMMHDSLVEHPNFKMIHPQSGIADNFEAPHWEDAYAQAMGLPSGYDFGAQRCSWFTHLLTDWAGDHGFLEELEFRLLKPNFMGDVTWLNGSVVSVDPAAARVQIRIDAVNQLDQTSATGLATVRLPSRAA